MKEAYQKYCELYDISEKGKTMETVKRSVVTRGCGKGGMNRQSTEDFQSSETILCDTIVVDTWHYTFVQMDRLSNTKSEP